MSWWNLAFRSQLPETVKREFEHARALLNGFLANEHNADGSHGDITRNGRPLITPWVVRPFAAADFVGYSPMVWAVAQSNIVTNSYKIIDDVMIVAFGIHSTTLSGTAAAGVTISIPEGHTSPSLTVTYCRVLDNGVDTPGICYVNPGERVIRISRTDNANLTTGAGVFYVQGTITFQIDR